jgi:hypothetical protein
MKTFFNNLKNQLIADYKATPGTVILESIGTTAALVAATCLALIGPGVNFVFVFSFYLIGSVTWFIASAIRKNSFNLILNLGFGTLNIIGLSKAILTALHLHF